MLSPPLWQMHHPECGGHAGKGRSRNPNPPTASHRGSESQSISSSYWFLLIHAPDPRPLGCPHILCQLSNEVGLFSIPLGRRYQVQGGQRATFRRQVQRYVSSCLSQTRTKISSTFCSRICLLSGGRHCIFCNRINHFVRLSECRMKILPQNLFSFWSILYFLWILLPFKKKRKKKAHPYIFSVYGSVFQDTFSTKCPELERLLSSPTHFQHLPLLVVMLHGDAVPSPSARLAVLLPCTP